MCRNRLLIVVLICCVIAREDFSFVVASVSHSRPAPIQPTDADPMHEGAVAPDGDSEFPDEGFPPLHEFPAEDSEIPAIFEADLDSEAEEILCLGEFNGRCGFVDPCLLYDANVFSVASFTSICTLKKLRI